MAKMLVMSLLPMASTMQVVERETHQEFDFDGLKASFVSMAAKSATAGKIDQATIEAVTGFLDTINNDLLGALEQDRNAYQGELDTAEADVHACDTARNSWFEGTFVSWNTNVSSARGGHSSCRSFEAQTYSNYTGYCETMHDRVCSWEVCSLPTGGFAGGDTDDVDIYMNCICDFFAEHSGSYYEERNNCDEAHGIHDAQVIVCDGEQSSFESEYCMRETQVQNKCEAYDGCRFSTETSYLGIKSNIEALEQISQAQFVALQHLICYGQAILNNSTDLSVCESSVSDDCEGDYECAWPVSDGCAGKCPTIVYDTLDSFIACAEPVSGNGYYPCAAPFLGEFYGAYTDTKTPVDDCTTCADAKTQANAYGGTRVTDPNPTGMP